MRLTTTQYKESKVSRQIISVEKFIESYGPALEEYLHCQYNGNGHILDLLAASSEFFSVSLHSVGVTLDLVDYTELAATIRHQMEPESPSEESEQ